jgi:hypothetical protein
VTTEAFARSSQRAQFLELVRAQMLDSDEAILHDACSDQLVQFHLDGSAVRGSASSDQEDHQ